jgi:hypothetical protein
VTRVATAPLATKGRRDRPVLAHPQWPVTVQPADGSDVRDALLMASVARREEKGSDVNVATHLVIDVLTDAVDAVVVVSNDSDLELPVRFSRGRVPVGLVNPTRGYPAGRLNGDPGDGVGGHWWHQLHPADLQACQLPEQIGALRRPAPW